MLHNRRRLCVVTILGVLGFLSPSVTQGAYAATLPVAGAISKPSSFTITPPWSSGTHTLVHAYGTYEHKNTNDCCHSNDYYALDFDLAKDEAVYPVAGGTVVYAGWASGGWSTYGQIVYIDHGNGFQSLYAHLDTLTVKTGQTVDTGTSLGGAGSTGGWPTVHLHFALYSGGKFQNSASGTGPYGGQAVVPEPFSACSKNGGQSCEDLVNGDVLTKEVIAAVPTCTDVSASGDIATGDNNTVLMLAPTLDRGCSSLEAQAALALNLNVQIVSGSQWTGMSAADFGRYRAIVQGDPVCETGTSAVDPADSNKSVWGPQINGNTIIIGTDPVYHSYYGNNSAGAHNVIVQGMKFATAVPGKTGAYIDLSCYEAGDSPNTPVPLLNGLNTLPLPDGSTPTDTNTAFTVQGADCSDSGHITATDGAVLSGLLDSDLSSWECSVHEGFDRWPADFKVLALDEESTATYTSPDGTVRGLPYILVRGEGVTSITPVRIEPPAGASGSGDTTTDPYLLAVGSGDSVTISVCTRASGCTGAASATAMSHRLASHSVLSRRSNRARLAAADLPVGTLVTLHVGATTYTAPVDASGLATFSITPPTDGSIAAIYATYVDPTSGRTVTSDVKFYKFSVPSDTSPPTTTASLAPLSPDGKNSWYVHSVVMTLQPNDPDGASDVASTKYSTDGGSTWVDYTAPVTFSDDGRYTVLFYSTDRVGNRQANQSVTFQIDQTKPTISAALSPASPATTGWYNKATGAPTVSFPCNDATSGIDGACPAAHTFGEGANQTYSASVSDNAGNTNSAGVSGINVDLTPPTCTVTMTPNTIWPPNKKMVPVTASVVVNDAGSGPKDYVLSSITSNEGDIATEAQGFVVGQQSASGQLLADRLGTGNGRVYTLTYTASDKAGNTSTCTGTVSVPHDQGK